MTTPREDALRALDIPLPVMRGEAQWILEHHTSGDAARACQCRSCILARHVLALAERVERLEKVAEECRAWFVEQIDTDVRAACPYVPDNETPDRSRMEELSRPMIEETEALLARIVAALEDKTNG